MTHDPETCPYCKSHSFTLSGDWYLKTTGSSLEEQIDGDHYKKLKIQPAVYSHSNGLSWHQGEIIKYITRYKDKNGRADLEKARHLINMLIELEYDSP